MRANRSVYCTFDFLRKTGLIDKEIQTYQQFFIQEFLLKSELLFNKDDKAKINELANKLTSNTQNLENSFIYQLMVKDLEGSNSISVAKWFPDITSQQYQDVDETHLNSIFLIDKDASQCVEASEKYGTITFNNELLKFDYLNKNKGKAISSKVTDWSWLNSIDKGRYPSLDVGNAMIIIDPFLLQDVTNYGFDKKIENNLYPIFKQLLPAKLNKKITYQFDIYVRKDSNWINDDWKERYDFICDSIKYCCPNLKFDVAIYDTKEFHDRIIITNNVSIICGYGFDIISQHKQPKPTKVDIQFPFIQTFDAALDEYILALMPILQNIKKTAKRFSCYGNTGRLNRIIKYYMG